jgi:ABC-type Co2+ transport system permease subunit
MSPEDTSVSKQIVIYFVSLFVAPFGYWYAWKYLRAGDNKSKRIGIIATILTTISLIVTALTLRIALDSLTQSISIINNLGI